MANTTTTRYDIAEHLRAPEEMAAYLEACIEEADGDAAFIAKALGRYRACEGYDTGRARAYIKRSPESARRVSTPF